jgi:hypothetical protein
MQNDGCKCPAGFKGDGTKTCEGMSFWKIIFYSKSYIIGVCFLLLYFSEMYFFSLFLSDSFDMLFYGQTGYNFKL